MMLIDWIGRERRKILIKASLVQYSYLCVGYCAIHTIINLLKVQCNQLVVIFNKYYGVSDAVVNYNVILVQSLDLGA